MKQLLLIQIMGLFGLMLYAQNYVDVDIFQPVALQADAGSDTTISQGTTIQIGGSPTANFGYGNYTYSWTPWENLSGASISNPEVTLQNSTIYVLTVTDGMACTAIDTVEISVSNATNVQRQGTDFGIRIYPNPNEGSVILEINSTILQGIETLIRDMSGKVVFRSQFVIHQGKNVISMDLSTLPKGSYLFEIPRDGLPYLKKLVVY